MEKYSSYKDSGVQWLGQIPSHWEVKHLRNFLTLFSEKGYGDAQLLSVTREKGVILRDRDDKEENHNYVPDDLSGYKHLMPGDFVINKMKSWQGSYGVSEYEGIVSPAYFTCKLKGVDPQFFSQAIRSKAYIGFFMQYSKGIRVDQWDLDPSSMKDIPFILPPLDEQKRIVPYLDAATAKIDEAIAQQQRMIDLLNERKQIIINDAVSSGLGNEFSALTSFEGRESITISKGWRLLPLKAKISFVNGYAFDSESFMKEGEMPVIRISNISDGTVSYDDIVYVDRDKGLEPFLTKGGDLLIAMSGATTGKVGFDIDGGSYINQRVGIIRSSCQKWVYYWLMTSFFKEYVYLSALGSAQPNISCSGIKNFRILYPEDGNYSNIVDRLDVICQEIDKALGAFQHQIDLLQERKQIIINDVVTGKVRIV